MTQQNFVVLNRNRHKSITFTQLADYSFAKEQNVVPLLPFEVQQAASYFPVLFPDRKHAVPHALLGLGRRNIFVDDQGHWKAPYIPLIIANYPFSIIEVRFSDSSKNEKPQYVIGIDENAPHFHQQNGLRLFDEKGEPVDELKRIENSILIQYRRYEAMKPTLDELAHADVFSEKVITVKYNGKQKNVGGLRSADREKILSLSYETLGHWVKKGIMELLYTHWQSMRHLPVLLEDHSTSTTKTAESNS